MSESKLIPFVNSQGNIIELDEKLTIEDLIKLGVVAIRLAPKDEPTPLEGNWWIEKQN